MADYQFSVKSAGRALQVLEYVISAGRAVTFTEIQNARGVPKSSLSYLLDDLQNYGYLAYDPVTTRYSLGMRLIQYAAMCLSGNNIIDEITLTLNVLSNKCGEATHAAVLDGRFITYLARAGSSDISLTSSVGLNAPAHSTALGRALLSQLSDDELYALFEGVKLEKMTPFTLTDPLELMEELRRIRQQKYAYEVQQSVINCACIAVPVYDRQTGKPRLAISVTVAMHRMTDEYFQKLLEMLWEAANVFAIKTGAR